jgi:hypothetical protein
MRKEEITAMEDETFGNRIVIQMYHNHPPTPAISEQGNPKTQPWMRVVWDGNCEEAAQLASGLDSSSENGPGVTRAYNQMVIQWLEKDFPGHELPFGKEHGAAVFHLLGTMDQMTSLANRWAAIAIEDAMYVSGDDSYYDYYPDYLNGLHQLCEQIGWHRPYNEVRKHVKAEGAPYEDDEEDLIPDAL